MSSAFKSLYSDMLRSGGSANVPKKTIKCYVKESFPHFLVTDGFFYVACYFTKQAVSEFHSKFSNMNITDLRSRVIVISDWSLECANVNSSNVFTSYGGVEVRLVVRSFKPVTTDKDTPALTRHPVNLFRDEEIKNLINNAHHAAAVKSARGNMPEINASAKGVAAGIVSGAGRASFKTGNTATVDMNAIFKQEKGSLPSAGKGVSGGARVKGGAKAGKAGASRSKSNVARALTKSTPGANKKSTVRVKSRAGLTPTAKGTTDNSTMRQFKKMMGKIKRK